MKLKLLGWMLCFYLFALGWDYALTRWGENGAGLLLLFALEGALVIAALYIYWWKGR